MPASAPPFSPPVIAGRSSRVSPSRRTAASSTCSPLTTKAAVSAAGMPSDLAVSRLADGRSYIVTRGERRFAVDALVSDAEPYLVGRVHYLDEPEGDDPSSHLDEALEALGRYLVAVLAVTDDARGERALTEELKGVAPVEVAWRIAGSIAVDPVEQQALLEMPSASERLVEETRIPRRETDQLGDLLVRLRAKGERQELN